MFGKKDSVFLNLKKANDSLIRNDILSVEALQNMISKYGIKETAQLIQKQFYTAIDYTRIKQQLFDNKDIDSIYKEITSTG